MSRYESRLVDNDLVSRQTKIRCLKFNAFNKLVNILGQLQRWKEIAGRIKHPDTGMELFGINDINILEGSGSPANHFLMHWGTSGRTQPTLGDLIRHLEDATLYQAANSVKQEILNEASYIEEERNSDATLDALVNLKIQLTEQCSQDSDVSDNYNQSRNFNVSSSGSLPSETIATSNSSDSLLDSRSSESIETSESSTSAKVLFFPDCDVSNYKYSYLQSITGDFCEKPLTQGGNKVGEGQFGKVFYACSEGQYLAVKKLREIDEQFFIELEALSKCDHENLLPLLGYSNDGPYYCLIYRYMPNGTLQNRLACLGGSEPIPWRTRISIGCGVARGITYLHTFASKPLVHRDIKSANILLDKDMIPKIGDFGIVRVGSRGISAETTEYTTHIKGTAVYMADEAHAGDVSVKLDVFSYGVVLMELLTALPPYDEKRDNPDLISHMKENCKGKSDILNLLDTKAGPWDKVLAVHLYNIALCCIKYNSKERPSITEILPVLEQISSSSASTT